MRRRYQKKKATVEESHDLTIFQLKKYRMLEGGHNATVIEWVVKNTGKESSISLEVNMTSEPYARLAYSVSDREGVVIPYDSKVDLVTTPCNLGGVRYWFACPWCGRRVGGLYLAPGERHFMCRDCNSLTYNSRNRCVVATFGHTSRQIKKLRSEIKRWTWRGRPTRKVRRLQCLEWKMGVLSPQMSARFDRFRTAF